MSNPRIIRGSCLCAGVRYRITGPVGEISHCHCSMCRKAHGAAFATYAPVRRGDFEWLDGESLVRGYPSSPGIERTFCERCGSTLQFIKRDDPEYVELALGTLDDDPGVRPALHIWVDSMAPWDAITDRLPCHREDPPDEVGG